MSFEAQSLFIRILTLVDDFGRYDARIPILHGQCFALRDDIKPQRTAAFRSELQQAKLIEVYALDGREYLQINQWQERARSDKSRFPDPPITLSQDSAADGSGAQDSAASLAITSSPSTIVPIPSTNGHSPKPRRTRFARTPLDDDDFKLFWAQYPRKENIGNAEEAWVKNNCKDFVPKIMTALRAKKISQQWTKEGGQWIPYAQKWLNARGWEDEGTSRPNSLNENLHLKIPIQEY